MKFIRPNAIQDTGGFSRTSTATYFDADGVLKVAAANVPRIDYDPATKGFRGLLLEPSRTNLLTQSEFANGLTDAPARSANLAASAFSGLTGTTGLSFVRDPAASVWAYKTYACTVGAIYTFSVFVRMADGGAPVVAGNVPVSDFGLVFCGGYDVPAIIQDCGGGLYRVFVSAAATAITHFGVAKWAANTDRAFTVSGYQLELGNSATSYIPTAGASVTRAADVVTGTGLIYSNVPETDYPAWAAGTAYSVGARVIRTTTHGVYERVVAGTTGTAPENDTINWTYVGPTSRWAMFDEKVGTVTSRADSISVILKPGRANGLGLLNVSAAQVSVSVAMGGETVFNATINLTNGTRTGSWYAYFYEPIYSTTEVALTDLLDAALMNLPAAGDAVITVTLSRPGGTVSCGMLVVGRVFEVGTTQWAPSVGIRDFSFKERDAFGNVSLKEGDYARVMSATVEVPAALADTVANNVSRYRARNVLWIGAKQYGSLVVYGFLSDWKLVHRDAFASIFNMEVEGMT